MVRDGMKLEIEFSGTDADAVALTKALMLSGVSVVTIGRTRRTLEQVFLEVIDNENRPG